MLEMNPHNNTAILNNVFDKAMQFSQSEHGYMHSLSMNQTVCYVCFSYNIKFNVAASF